jgi:hypothetical protein
MNEVKICSEPMTRLVTARNSLFGTLLFAYRNTTIPLTDPSSDINGDGRPDIVIAANTAVVVLEGIGDGTFADPIYFSGVAGVSLTTGDYNKDFRPDLAVFSGGPSTTLQSVSNDTDFLGPVPELTWVRTGVLSRLIWYTNYANFALEYRRTFGPADSWAGAPGSHTAIDCQNFYTLSTNYTGFYRLHGP